MGLFDITMQPLQATCGDESQIHPYSTKGIPPKDDDIVSHEMVKGKVKFITKKQRTRDLMNELPQNERNTSNYKPSQN